MLRSIRCLLLAGAAAALASCGGGVGNGGGSAASPVPSASITASPTSVTAGGNSELTWSSTGATTCSASGGWSGALATSGSQNTGALTGDTSFSLTCTGAGGTSQPATVTITVNSLPTVQISANPAVVIVGSSTTLTWASTGATACTASDGWSGAQVTSGSFTTPALPQSTSYTLSCTGPGGSAQASTTVNATPIVVAAPTVTLNAAPAVIAAGAKATLTWSSTNATACTASGGWSGTQASSGSFTTPALSQATSYSLSCSGTGGSAQAVATVNIMPTAVLNASPTVIASGQTATLTWTSNNATSCIASNGWSGTLPSAGTQVTAALSATTTYALVCTGPGGASAPSAATVTVSNITMSIAPKTAPLTLGRTQQFTATVPGDAQVTWTVDGVANGNSTTGTINAAGLYTAGAAGAHTILATSVANAAQTATAVAAVTGLAGMYTYHNDLSRDGANIQEYALTPANVNTTNFGKVASCPVDGVIQGQPLWVANVTMAGAKHNVVFVTTQHDSLFAFDADANSCSLLWSASMIDLAHGASAGETSVPGTAVGLGFGDIMPEVGINGTPVVDPSTGTLYVVSKSVDSTVANFFPRLHAIDITSGNERAGSPVLIVASYPSNSATVVFNSKQQNQRAGLALANGVVYVSWGSHEDSVPWYGWVMGYQYNGAGWTQTAVFNSAPNTTRAGIWMGGGAPPVDAGNHLYFTTGNGNFDATNTAAPNNDYGDSLLQMSPTLQVNQFFTPTDQMNDFTADNDFGAGGAATLADLPAGNTITHALVCGGKDGTLYVINRDLLGGLGDTAAVQVIPLGFDNYSTPTLWNNNLFAAGASGPVNSFQLNQSTAQFTSTATSTHTFGFPGATLSLSAAGTQNGVVWAIDSHSYCTSQAHSCGPAVLYAYDAGDVTRELWNSSTMSSDMAGNAVKFSVPTVVNGRVFVATRGNNVGGADSSSSTPGELEIYGLLQ